MIDDRDESINHIISECSKLAQKEYKTRHDWVGTVIHWELLWRMKCTNFSGILTYKRITKSCLDDVELWTLLSQRKTGGNWKNVKRTISTWTLLGIEKVVEHESDDNKNWNFCSSYSHQTISTWGHGNNRTSWDHPYYCIIEICQNNGIFLEIWELLSLKLHGKTISWCEKQSKEKKKS